MEKMDTSIDTYISMSHDFTKPILKRIREIIHKGYPEVEEKIKWSFPKFEYSGNIICNMAAFKDLITQSVIKINLLRISL